MTQTLATGSPVHSRYGFGRVGRQMYPANKLYGAIVGMAKGGKSHFIQSHPSAAVFNFDKTSTTNPNPTVALWPGVGDGGKPVDHDGTPIVLSWEGALDKIDMLLTLASEDRERPDTIFFDSITSWIGLLKNFVIRKHGKSEWHELDGRRGWDMVYDTITDTSTRLRDAGYGVYHIHHVIESKVNVSEEQTLIRPELTITDTFWKRLFFNYEIVMAVEKEWIKDVREVEQPDIENPKTGKKIKVKPKRITTTRPRWTLISDSEVMEGITGSRVAFPAGFELPSVGGWEAFKKMYDESAYQVVEDGTVVVDLSPEQKGNDS